MQKIPVLNTQPREKLSRSDGSSLHVNSIFYTLQGEGPYAGCPAVFIRLAGCNLQCPQCDTEYTTRRMMTVEEIFDCIIEKCEPSWMMKRGLVVISGGEPFRQTLLPLVRRLLSAECKVQVETNGTLYQAELPYHHKDFMLVCSPKTGKVAPGLWPYIKALKYVATLESLVGSEDGLPTHALEHPNGGMLARPSFAFKGEIYLQPVDEKDDHKNRLNAQAVVASCLKNGYRLCLQMHKIVDVE